MPRVIETQTTMLTQEVDYAAEAQDQGKALDEAVAWATAKGWELVSVIWREETDNGHVFVVTYNKKATIAPIPTRRNKD